jgi:REP element-mobilizing transposase RayT
MSLRGRSRFTDEHFFFVTTTVLKHTPVSDNSTYCDILLQNIKHYQLKYRFQILAYVIMPTHFHWIVETGFNGATISIIMRDIKKFNAWDILEQLEINKFNKLGIFNKPTRRGQRRQFWTSRFDDVIIRNMGMLRSIVEYIHNNPIMSGLVEQAEDYPYSSARNYILNDHSMLEVDTDYLM